MTELEKLAEICHQNLKNSEDCLNYLKQRGMDQTDIEKYKIGFFPQNLNVLSKYVDFEILKHKKIIRVDDNSDYRDYNYLIIPIINEYKETVGICGRTLLSRDDMKLIGVAKYRNSSFKKKSNLFGLKDSLPHIIKSNRVWIVEGYFDQISMSKYGCKNSICLGGTAFSKDHFLKLLGICNRFNFIYDNDEAGMINSERVYKKFSKYNAKINFYKLKDYKDIDEYLQAKKTLKNLSEDVEPILF